VKSKIAGKIRRIDLHKLNRIRKFLIKSAVVGIIILTVILFKKMNFGLTNSFLDVTKRWTEYEFSIYNDGKRLFGKVQSGLESSVEVFNTYNPIAKEFYPIPIEGELVGSYEEGISKGVDIRVDKNIEEEPISISDGIVTNVEQREQKGYFITITSDDKEFVYGYFMNSDLSEGDEVSSGDLIGELGRNKDGFRYLRLEIWEDNKAKDPLKYIDMK